MAALAATAGLRAAAHAQRVLHHRFQVSQDPNDKSVVGELDAVFGLQT